MVTKAHGADLIYQRVLHEQRHNASGSVARAHTPAPEATP